MEDNQPKGIGFFNIKSGETHYARLEAQIQAYINSSDMGINASRGQDMGWRLEPEWVKKVKEFRRNENKMEALVARNGGQKVTTVQILYAIYGEQLRAAQELAEEGEAPFEEQYLSDIATPKAEPVVAPAAPNEIPEIADEEDLMPAEGVDNGDTTVPTDTTPSVTTPGDSESSPTIGNKPTSSKKATVKQK